jgi:hypothetical protein
MKLKPKCCTSWIFSYMGVPKMALVTLKLSRPHENSLLFYFSLFMYNRIGVKEETPLNRTRFKFIFLKSAT